MILEVVQHPDPVLRRKADPVGPPELAWLADNARDLVDTLHNPKLRGVGLALAQVGRPYAAFVFCPSGKPGTEQIIYNPTLEPVRLRNEPGEVVRDEGCLSVARSGPRVRVARAYRIRVSYSEIVNWWNPKRLRVERAERRDLFDFDARVFQHEWDHLQGVELGGADIDAIVRGFRAAAEPGPVARRATEFDA